MTAYEIGILSALLSIFINYIIGKPGSEFSPHEIFSFYTVWLSKRRLEKERMMSKYNLQLIDSMKTVSTWQQRVQVLNDFKYIIYNAAEPLFTWERMIGMCVVCTGFWIAIACGLIMGQNLINLIIIVVVSHVTVRILNKIL